MRRRGAPKQINGALNRPTTKCGVDYRLLAACGFVSIVAFLFASKVFACLLFPTLLSVGALVTRREPEMFRLWVLSFRMGSQYDPGK